MKISTFKEKLINHSITYYDLHEVTKTHYDNDDLVLFYKKIMQEYADSISQLKTKKINDLIKENEIELIKIFDEIED